MCMTLSGHTSTLPRLVIWGAGFQGHLLDSAKTRFCSQTGTHLNRGRDIIVVITVRAAIAHTTCIRVRADVDRGALRRALQ